MSRLLKRILGGILGSIVGLAFGALFAGMVFGPPVAFLWETVDILRMRAEAPGKVLSREFKSGNKGTSRAIIEYEFSVNGRRIVSDRKFPGFLGNHASSTGGAAIGRDYPVGKAIVVRYSPADPQLCALEYGWEKWSIALTSVYTGLVLLAFRVIKVRSAKLSYVLFVGGAACIVYGACELFLGPQSVRVRNLHWHAGFWCVAAVGAMIYDWGGKRFPIPTGDSTGPGEQPADAESSTPFLALSLLCVMTAAALIILSGMWRAVPWAWHAVTALFVGAPIPPTQWIATIAVIVLATFAIAAHVGMVVAVFAVSRSLLRRIAWHRRQGEPPP